MRTVRLSCWLRQPGAPTATDERRAPAPRHCHPAAGASPEGAKEPADADAAPPTQHQEPPAAAHHGGGGALQSGAIGSGHAAAPRDAGLTGVLKQGWEDLKHGGAKAPHAVSFAVRPRAACMALPLPRAHARA